MQQMLNITLTREKSISNACAKVKPTQKHSNNVTILCAHKAGDCPWTQVKCIETAAVLSYWLELLNSQSQITNGPEKSFFDMFTIPNTLLS